MRHTILNQRSRPETEPLSWRATSCLTGLVAALPSDRPRTGRCFEPGSIPSSSKACVRRPMAAGPSGPRASSARSPRQL